MSVRAACLATIVVVLAGCATEPPPSKAELFFPQHGMPLGAGDAALLEGVAILDDGCMWIEANDGTRYLPLWPADVQLGKINSLPAVLGPDRTLLVEVGDVGRDIVQLGGSEASAEATRDLVGEIPERCAAGRFWVVGDVLSRP